VDYEVIAGTLERCVFTEHARREMESEPYGIIHVSEVVQCLRNGEIIEEYPDDRPYPSCLVLGRTAEGRVLHVVCAPVVPEQRLIVITTYQPDPDRWDPAFRRRRQ
jgi:hypothetical protein